MNVPLDYDDDAERKVPPRVISGDIVEVTLMVRSLLAETNIVLDINIKVQVRCS